MEITNETGQTVTGMPLNNNAGNIGDQRIAHNDQGRERPRIPEECYENTGNLKEMS